MNLLIFITGLLEPRPDKRFSATEALDSIQNCIQCNTQAKENLQQNAEKIHGSLRNRSMLVDTELETKAHGSKLSIGQENKPIEESGRRLSSVRLQKLACLTY